MRCRALPCGAVLCRVVPCFAVLSLSYITDDTASWQIGWARDSMSWSVLYSVEPYLSILREQGPSSMMYRYTAAAAAVSTRMSSLGIRAVSTAKNSEAQQSTAKHSKAQRNHPCTKPRTKDVPIGVRIKKVCPYMHAASYSFSWSMELLTFASRLYAPKMSDHLLHLSFQSILPCERA